MHDGSGNSFELALIGCKCIGAYVKNKKNQNQVICFGHISGSFFMSSNFGTDLMSQSLQSH